MKNAFLLIALLISFNIFSGELMTPAQQEKKISDVAKGLRREHWVAGYEHVNSSHSRFDSAKLEEYLSEDSHFQDYPNKDEAYAAKMCLVDNLCELFQISVSSEYYGGYGVMGYLVLLDIASGNADIFAHQIYAE